MASEAGRDGADYFRAKFKTQFRQKIDRESDNFGDLDSLLDRNFFDDIFIRPIFDERLPNFETGRGDDSAQMKLTIFGQQAANADSKQVETFREKNFLNRQNQSRERKSRTKIEKRLEQVSFWNLCSLKYVLDSLFLNN